MTAPIAMLLVILGSPTGAPICAEPIRERLHDLLAEAAREPVPDPQLRAPFVALAERHRAWCDAAGRGAALGSPPDPLPVTRRARELLKDPAAAAPDRLRYLLGLTLVSTQSGQKEGALVLLRIAEEQPASPLAARANLLVGEYYADRARDFASKAFLEKALELAKQDGVKRRARYDLALVLERRGENDTARGHLEAVLEAVEGRDPVLAALVKPILERVASKPSRRRGPRRRSRSGNLRELMGR